MPMKSEKVNHVFWLNWSLLDCVYCARVDGGVSNNGFLMQLVSNLTGCTLDRPEHADMTSLGAAFLAGLATGMIIDSIT